MPHLPIHVYSSSTSTSTSPSSTSSTPATTDNENRRQRQDHPYLHLHHQRHRHAPTNENGAVPSTDHHHHHHHHHYNSPEPRDNGPRIQRRRTGHRPRPYTTAPYTTGPTCPAHTDGGPFAGVPVPVTPYVGVVTTPGGDGGRDGGRRPFGSVFGSLTMGPQVRPRRAPIPAPQTPPPRSPARTNERIRTASAPTGTGTPTHERHIGCGTAFPAGSVPMPTFLPYPRSSRTPFSPQPPLSPPAPTAHRPLPPPFYRDAARHRGPLLRPTVTPVSPVEKEDHGSNPPLDKDNRDKNKDGPQKKNQRQQIPYRDRRKADTSYGLPSDYRSSFPTLATELDDFFAFMTLPATGAQESPVRETTAIVYLMHAKLFLGWFWNYHRHDIHRSADSDAAAAANSAPSLSSSSESTPSTINRFTDPKTLSLHHILPNRTATSAHPVLLFATWLRTSRSATDSYGANVLRGLSKLLKFRSAPGSGYGSGARGAHVDVPAIQEVRRLGIQWRHRIHRRAERRATEKPESPPPSAVVSPVGPVGGALPGQPCPFSPRIRRSAVVCPRRPKRRRGLTGGIPGGGPPFPPLPSTGDGAGEPWDPPAYGRRKKRPLQ